MAVVLHKVTGVKNYGGNALSCKDLVSYISNLPAYLQEKCFDAATEYASNAQTSTSSDIDSNNTRKNSEWEAVTDPSTGKPYYCHKKSRRSVWNLSDIATEATDAVEKEDDNQKMFQENPLTASAWVEVEDAKTGKAYYFN